MITNTIYTTASDQDVFDNFPHFTIKAAGGSLICTCILDLTFHKQNGQWEMQSQFKVCSQELMET